MNAPNSSRIRCTSHVPAAHRWAILASVLVGLIGLQWWLAPRTYPFGPGDESGELSLLTRLGSDTAAMLAVTLGAIGVLTAGALGRRRPSRPAVVLAAVQAVVLGYVVPDITALMLLAYVLALTGPVAVTGFVAYRCLRRRPGRGMLVIAGFGAVAVLSGVVTPSVVADLGGELAGGFEEVGSRPLYVLGALATGALWGAVAVRAVGDRRAECAACGRISWGRWARPERAAVWGRRVTWAAALCPLPYALLRLTWLTPWPFGISGEELADRPGIRLFGLLLGVAALGGATLTLGLTYRWGEVFPRWLPVLRGRPVPIAAATVPALAVAVSVTVAGHSIVQAAVTQVGDWREGVALSLLLPFPVWGPLLAAAAVGYALRRRGDDAACRTGRTLTGVPADGGVPTCQPPRSV